jgi:hypothetical protein
LESRFRSPIPVAAGQSKSQLQPMTAFGLESRFRSPIPVAAGQSKSQLQPMTAFGLESRFRSLIPVAAGQSKSQLQPMIAFGYRLVHALFLGLDFVLHFHHSKTLQHLFFGGHNERISIIPDI